MNSKSHNNTELQLLIASKDPSIQSKREELKSKYKTQIEDTKYESDKENRDDSGVYLFISFDLVDSTKYKSIETDWAKLIKFFYEHSKGSMFNDVDNNIKVWKLVGDEILFYLRVGSLHQLRNITQKVSKVMKNLTKEIHNNFHYSKGIIYVKGAMFIANVSTLSNGSENHLKHSNYIITTENIDYNSKDYKFTIKDFLGPDIDLGFRLANFSHKNQLVVSLELAVLICNSSQTSQQPTLDFNENFRIISIKRLKGVWHNRGYPIIWYRENEVSWNESNLFEYDDEFILSNEYKEYIGRYQKNYNTYDDMYKILNESGRDRKVNQILELINTDYSIESMTPSLYDAETEVPLTRSTEVHYVLIGIDENDKIAVFEKMKNRDKKRDFGCAHSKGYRAVLERLKDYYEPLYKDIEFLNNEVGLPIPISMYEYNNDAKNRDVTGFMFVARISAVKSKPSDYESAQMMDLEEIKSCHLFYQNSYENAVRAIQMLEAANI